LKREHGAELRKRGPADELEKKTELGAARRIYPVKSAARINLLFTAQKEEVKTVK